MDRRGRKAPAVCGLGGRVEAWFAFRMSSGPSAADYLSKDWSELSHAYGTAEDVPGLLRDLNSLDEEVRKTACSELFGSIWHQGTVYPATVKALPELVTLFWSSDCVDRDSVAMLLACIADGEGYYRVHSNQPDLTGAYAKILSHKGSTVAEEIAKETDYLAVIRQMALDFMPLLEPYLDSEEPFVRETVVSAMKRYAGHFPHFKQRLIERLAVEKHEDVRFRIQEVLGELEGES